MEQMKPKDNKFYDYMIINQQYNTPQMQGPRGEISSSGPFKICNNFGGNFEGCNNQTGTGYFANPNGYWNNTPPQFPETFLHQNTDIGALFPNEKGLINRYTMYKSNSPPQMSTIFGYARIGEEYRTV